MGNSAPSILFSFQVKFSREPPTDFYLSGDRVQGIIQVVTNDNDNDLNRKYGPLYVELIGESEDFKAHHNRVQYGPLYVELIRESKDFKPHHNRVQHGRGVQIFFRKQARVVQLPNDNQKLGFNGLRSYRWVFDCQLNSSLPSSLPPDNEYDPCIYYYARVHLHGCTDVVRIFAFVVFTQPLIPLASRQPLQNGEIEASVRYKGVQLRGTLPNNGLAVPGLNLMLQLEIDNPLGMTIKSIQATLKQYRTIVNEESDFIIFTFNLPGFQPHGFNGKYRQSTFELSIPLHKCRVMAPTSSLRNVRYELQIQCHIHRLFNSYFTLTLPITCNTDHQQTLKIMDELKALPEAIHCLSNNREEKPPPSYEDFMASEILPKYDDIMR